MTLLTFSLHCSLFAADPAPRPVTVCSGANIIIKGDPLNMVPSSYSWESYQGDNWVTAPGLNTEQDYLVSSLHNPSMVNIAFTLRRKSTTGGITAYDSYYYVTVQPILPITNNVITLPLINSFCGSGTPGTITGSTPSNGIASFIYQWQTSEDNLNFKNIDGAFSKDYNPGVITTSLYLRRIAISDGCGTATTSNSIKLSVSSALTDNVITAPALSLLCANGDPTVINGNVPSGGNGNYRYSWQKSSDNITFTEIAGATGPEYDPPALSATSYFRRSVVSDPCNIPLISNTITIQVMPELVVPEPVNTTITICSGTGTTLSVKNPIAGISYNWYDSPAMTHILFTGNNYLTEALTTDKTYYVASNNGTCSSTAMGMVRVLVASLPNSDVIANEGKTSACNGSTALFSINGPNPDFTYNWYADSKGGIPIGSGTNWTTPKLSATTTFYLEVVNKEGCSSTLRKAAVVTVMPILAAAAVTVDSKSQHSITFKWAAVAGATGYQVSLDNGLSFTYPSSGSNGLTHTVTGLKGSESVTILVKALGTLACQESQISEPTTAETIKEFDDIFVPNAFTPNGDGKNDILYVRSQTVQSLAFYIYNQWGEQVFNSRNISYGWDGTFRGSTQPVGVYMYILKATMNDGREVNKKGTTTLIR